MKVLRTLLKILVPILILGAGFVGMRSLVLGRPGPKKTVRADLGPLVETIVVEKQDRPVTVRGTGTVQASREVAVTPEVSGRIIHVAPELVAGGFFREGQLLFEIEPADYHLLLERARAALMNAKYELTKMESQAEVARLEWEHLDLKGGDPNPLVLYGPQLENTQAAVASAEAALRQAEIDLERTTVRAPFNCRVRSEEVETGQYVRAGSPVAVLAGTDTAEVLVPLPLEDLEWLRIPRAGNGKRGTAATVSLATGNRTYEWRGRVARSLGEVDPRGRMARVVVRVKDPYGLREPRAGPDLDLGRFVDVALHGKQLQGIIALPRGTLRDGSTVWVVDEENQLRILPVGVLRLERREALIADGLPEGARVVVTNLTGAADGMALRVVGKGAQQ